LGVQKASFSAKEPGLLAANWIWERCWHTVKCHAVHIHSMDDKSPLTGSCVYKGRLAINRIKLTVSQYFIYLIELAWKAFGLVRHVHLGKKKIRRQMVILLPKSLTQGFLYEEWMQTTQLQRSSRQVWDTSHDLFESRWLTVTEFRPAVCFGVPRLSDSVPLRHAGYVATKPGITC